MNLGGDAGAGKHFDFSKHRRGHLHFQIFTYNPIQSLVYILFVFDRVIPSGLQE